MLGHSYLISGRRIAGRGRGRKLGYPTLNMATETHKLLPPHGVYASRVEVGHRYLQGMLYVGTRPTFGETGRSVETYLFDYDSSEEWAGLREESQRFHIYVERFVRPDIRFRSPRQLVEQLKKDEKDTRRLLAKGASVNTDFKPALTGGDLAAQQKRE